MKRSGNTIVERASITPTTKRRKSSAVRLTHDPVAAANAEVSGDRHLEEFSPILHRAAKSRLDADLGLRSSSVPNGEFHTNTRTDGQLSDHLENVDADLANNGASDTAARVRGQIDRVTADLVTGWAWDATAPKKYLLIDLLEDETRIARIVADEFRGDLERAGIGDGRHGFSVRLGRNVGALKLRCADTGIEITGVALIDRTSAVPEIPNQPSSELVGFIDEVGPDHVSGWVWEPARPERRIDVSVCLGGTKIGMAVANQFRHDLVTNGIGDGAHAFRFDLRKAPLIEGLNNIQLRCAITNMELPGSPIIFQYSNSTDALASALLVDSAQASEVDSSVSHNTIDVYDHYTGAEPQTKNANSPYEEPVETSPTVPKSAGDQEENFTGERSAAREFVAFHIDSWLLTTGGLIRVDGWAVADTGIDRIEIFVDDIQAGETTYGEHRPDVGLDHPSIEQSDRSGFVLESELNYPFASNHHLTAVVYTRGRTVRWETLSINAVESPAPEPAATTADDDSLKLAVDRPVLAGRRATDIVRGGLQVEGWALAREGVAEIQVSVDSEVLGRAKYGLRREDVGTSWPDWENSRLSGYALPVPARALPSGERVVTVEMLTTAGQHKHLQFHVQVEQPPQDNAPGSLRRKLTYTQRQTEIDILAGTGWHPKFCLILLIDGHNIVDATVQETLRSLAEQVYDNWCCIGVLSAAAPSLEPTIRDGVQVALETRFKIMSDSGLRSLKEIVATGDHDVDLVAFLSPGDILGCDALLEIAIAAGRQREADFFYTDERRLNPITGQVEPFFKPQWSPDLLLSTNYIGRLWCCRPALLERIAANLDDWWSLGEYDLVLRATEAARGIQRIPLVLCERAAASALDTQNREREALGRAAKRHNLDAEVIDGCASGYYQLRLKHHTSGLVSVIMPTGGKVDLLKTCVTGLFERTAYRNFELVILFNTMTRPEVFPYLDQLATDPRVKVIDSQGPFNFSRICNLGAANAAGEFLLFLNDDIEMVDPGWLDALIAQAERPEVGAVGARLLYPDGKVQHAGMFWTGNGGRHAFRFASETDAGYFGLAVTTRNCIAVTGACILMRRSWFHQIGGFDEEHPIINNDVDLCLRSWAQGGRVVYEPAATLIHHELASRADLPDEYDVEGFDRRWGDMLGAGDPYYHPSLARDRDDFSPDDEPVQVIYAGRPLFRRDEIRRLLVSKLDHLGDFVTAVPAITRLREHLPDAEIYLLVPPGSASLAAFLPGIKEIIPFEFFFARSSLGPRNLTDEDMAELRRRLSPYRFDLAIDLRKSPDTRTVLRFTGARWLVGYDRDGRFPWLDIALEWEGDDKLIAKRSHIGDDLCRLADAVALATATERMVFGSAPSPSDNNRKRAQTAKHLVYIHPGVGTETRQWPPRQFARLIDLLVKYHDVGVRLLGSPDEAPIVEEVLANVTRADNVESLVGKTKLTDLPELLRSGVLFVGNNSGPQHIAAGVGLPTIGIHSGVVDAREWGPIGPSAVAVRREMRCSPCYLAEIDACPRALACMTELRAEDVYEVARRMLLITREPCHGAEDAADPLARNSPTLEMPANEESKRDASAAVRPDKASDRHEGPRRRGRSVVAGEAGGADPAVSRSVHGR